MTESDHRDDAPRMGEDGFPVTAPGIAPDAAASRGAWIYVLPLALLVGFGLLAWQVLRTPADERKALPSALIAKPVPVMDLASLRPGEPNFDTAVLQGPGVKVVNIWASWCGPCRVEHPELMKLAEKGVAVYGINYKDDPEKARAFLRDLGDPFTLVGADERGRMGIEWGVYGVPETFIIDAEGRIAHKHVGPIQVDDLEKRILPALRAAGWDG